MNHVYKDFVSKTFLLHQLVPSIKAMQRNPCSLLIVSCVEMPIFLAETIYNILNSTISKLNTCFIRAWKYKTLVKGIFQLRIHVHHFPNDLELIITVLYSSTAVCKKTPFSKHFALWPLSCVAKDQCFSFTHQWKL